MELILKFVSRKSLGHWKLKSRCGDAIGVGENVQADELLPHVAEASRGSLLVRSP